MKCDFVGALRCRPAIFTGLLFWAAGISQAGEIIWEHTNDTLACQLGGQVLWRFSWATNHAKPFFHPLALPESESLTTFKPKDHPWHYGLWFSWKYINGVNYWEEDKNTGVPQGPTRWTSPKIKTNPDGSATITMDLSYISPTNGTAVMTEKRELKITKPNAVGEVAIDWVSSFKAGKEPLLLDRTHMPGEPNGAINGGYAGLSLRCAQAPAKCEFLTLEGPIEKYESDRARPNSRAAACNITDQGHTNGVAILSYSKNASGPSPWYMINSQTMRWFSPALLAPAPRHVQPHETFRWKFRILTKAEAWTPESLKKADKQVD